MINQISLSNVRIFDEQKHRFDLPKLTVFCGTNGSGKSTILKSLLLLRQSQGIGESASRAFGYLRFVGSQADLGTYLTFVYNREPQRNFTLSIRIQDEASPESLNVFAELGSLNPDHPHLLNAQQTRKNLPYCLEVSLTFTYHAAPTEVDLLKQEDSKYGDSVLNLGRGILERATFNLIFDEMRLLEWIVQRSGLDEDSDPEYEILIPEKYFNFIADPELITLEPAQREGFLKATTILNGLLPVYLIRPQILHDNDKDTHRKLDGNGDDDKEQVWGVYPLPPHINDPQQDFLQHLRRIYYLGPLRSPSQRYYLTNIDSNFEFDPRGEFLPYILRDYVDQPVPHLAPGSSDSIEVSLLEALNAWLFYLRVGEWPKDNSVHEIDISTLKHVVVEIEVKNAFGDELHALTDSGFGYSQVLPILVRCLLAGKGSTLIIEQPELHLNPALQVRIAEFFVMMSRLDKQIILETHSEHIVNTIRVLTSEDETGELANNTAIFFLDCTSGELSIHELSVQRDGTVPNWPSNFFGEAASLTGRLLRAQKKSRLKS